MKRMNVVKCFRYQPESPVGMIGVSDPRYGHGILFLFRGSWREVNGDD